MVTIQSRVATGSDEGLAEMQSVAMAWRSARSAWNHEALISPWLGWGLKLPASSGGDPVGSPNPSESQPVLPARIVRTPRPQQNLFPPFTEGLQKMGKSGKRDSPFSPPSIATLCQQSMD